MRTINKQQKNAGFIFSVFQDSKSKDENLKNHDAMLKTLILKNVSFKPVQGKYTYENGKTSSELGYYVESNEVMNDHELYDFVNQQCVLYNQESFLSIDSERNARLIFNNGKSENLGKFQCVDKDVAESSQAYTYCPKTDYYFICR